jgi:putative MATE family efflux protein
LSDVPENHTRYGTDLTTGSIPRNLVSFSVPMLIGSALQTAYSLINALWVGNRLGPDAMVAVTVSMPILFVLTAVAGGLTLATTVLVSQAYGAREIGDVRRLIGNSLVLVGTVALACLFAGHFVAAPLLRAMNTPATSLAMSVAYLRLLVWTVPCTFGIFLFAAVLRGCGDSKTPLYFQAVSVVLAAILDPLLMFGWLGFPKLGLNGTAVSTIVSQAVGVIALNVYLQRKRHLAAPEWRHLRADWETSWLTMKVGIPAMFQQGMISIGVILLTSLVNAFGRDGAAAFGFGLRVDQIAFMPSLTIGMAVSAMAGQNIGAGRLDRVRQVFRWGMIVVVGLTLIPSLMALSIPALLMRAFTSDRAVIDIGAVYLRISAFTYLGFAVLFVSNGIINGAGHTLATTIFSVVGLWGVRLPLAYHLSRSMHRIEGIWYAMVMSVSFAALISLSYYLSGRWKRPIRKKHEPPSGV